MNETFLQWLIGFLEGDGNFQTVKKPRKVQGVTTHYGVGYALHIGLATIDHPLLLLIQAQLGMGNITLYPDKDKTGEAHFAITKKADLVRLLNLISNYPLLTSHQRLRLAQVMNGLTLGIYRFQTEEEYRNWLASVNPTIVPFSSLDPIYVDNWIVGFINAEGHFVLKQSAFLLEHTDQLVLENISQHLGLSRSISAGKLRVGRKPTFSLSIYNSADRAKLIALFDRSAPLLGNKFNQYQAWLTRLPVAERTPLY